jgi:hypothetical protein
MAEHGYLEACISLGLEHRLHSPYEKSIVERTMEYLKDRTEAFDDYYPCMRDDGWIMQSQACSQMVHLVHIYAQ